MTIHIQKKADAPPVAVDITDEALIDALLGIGADSDPVTLIDTVKQAVQNAGGVADNIDSDDSAYKRISSRLKEIGDSRGDFIAAHLTVRVKRVAKPGHATLYGIKVIAETQPEQADEAPALEVIVPETVEPETVTAETVTTLENVPAQAFALDTYDPKALAKMGQQALAEASAEIDDVFERISARAEDEIKAMPEKIEPADAIRLTVLFDRRESLHSDAGLIERFKLGVICRRVSESSGYGDKAMTQLAEATGVHVNTVRQCRRLAERYDDNVRLFARFLSKYREKTGRPVRWYHVEKIIGTFSDVSVLGAEELAGRIARGIENAAERAEQAAGEAVDDDTMINLSEHAEATRVKAVKRLAQHKVAVDAGELPDGVFIPRDEGFMRTVSMMPDAIDGESPPEGGWGEVRIANDPHHTGTGGTGIKGSDFSCIPLKREHHDYLHQHGYKAFRKKYGVSVAYIIAQTLHLFITGVRFDAPSAMINAE